MEIYFGSGVELLIVSLAGRYPNASTVQNTSNCTANTAQYAAGKFKPITILKGKWSSRFFRARFGEYTH